MRKGVTFQLDVEWIKRLDEEAKTRELARSDIIRETIREKLERKKVQPK